MTKNGFSLLKKEIERRLDGVKEIHLMRIAEKARNAFSKMESWLASASAAGSSTLEAGARRLALTSGRTLALSLLVDHAQWSIGKSSDRRAMAAAWRFAQLGVNLIGTEDLEAGKILALDQETI
jgi:hypothetical protein